MVDKCTAYCTSNTQYPAVDEFSGSVYLKHLKQGPPENTPQSFLAGSNAIQSNHQFSSQSCIWTVWSSQVGGLLPPSPPSAGSSPKLLIMLTTIYLIISLHYTALQKLNGPFKSSSFFFPPVFFSFKPF